MASTSKYPRLTKHFAFYAAYHANPVNQLVHIVCVPLILATFLTMFSRWVPLQGYLTPELNKAVVDYTGAPFTLSTVAAAIYILYYLYLAPSLLGVAASIMVAVCYVAGMRLEAIGANAMTIAASVNIVGWLLQFWAHAKHEKRSPALLDNLFQAIGMAPLFVFIEVLLKFGMLKDLEAEAKPLVTQMIREFKDKKAAASTKPE